MKAKIVRASKPVATRSSAHAFTQFRPGLYRFLLRRLHSAENAEDLAQEVYLRLLRVSETTHVRSPQAYLYRIAFHVLYEFRLRARGEPTVFDSQAFASAAEQLPDEANQPDASYEDGARAERYSQLVAQLPPMQRAVLRLATHHDLSHAQIAEALGISVSTVRNHLYKAIDQCRHRIASRS
jgi:RNA polymerase sigma factor (sigma-70 family)